MADLTVKSRSMNALVIWFTAMFLIIAEECYGQEPFWETEEDIYESFQAIPPPEEIRNKMMKYLLERPKKSRERRYNPYYDIVFVLDSSHSISRPAFNLSVTAAQSLVKRFEPDSLFAAVTFGTSASVSFKFNSSKIAIEEIGKMQYQGGKKNILNALRTTQNKLLLNRNSGVQDGSRKRVVLVTNGPCDRKRNETANLQRIMWTATQIKTRGTEVFLVAVGHRIPRIEELVVIPSSTDAHFYRVSNMTSFKQIVDGIPMHIVYQDDHFDEQR